MPAVWVAQPHVGLVGLSVWARVVAIGLLSLSLAACSTQLSWPDQVSITSPAHVVLSAGTTIGQTVLAREAGLNGVEIYLAPEGELQGEVRLTLQAPPEADGAGVDLATASLLANSLTQPGYYHFAFNPQPASRQRGYYMRLEYAGPGAVLVGHGSPASYQQGALYRNNAPANEGQMAFRLTYDPALVARGAAGQLLDWLGWLGLATLLFVLPGWALLGWLWPVAGRLSWGEQLGLAAGLGLALYPILFLWLSLVGLRLGQWYAILPILLSVVTLGMYAARHWRCVRPRLWPVGWRSACLMPDLALVGVLGLTLFTRFWVARGLLAPMWGDSFQHTVIAQLLVDHGGLFDSWAPYAELHSFTYHFGLHSLVAVFHWMSGLALPEAMLWFGQILNGLAVLALYPLAVRVTGQRWAGVGAVLVAGLLSPMPMAYVNWGRYTQLAGQAILAVAVTIAWVYFDTRKALNWRLLVLAWVAWGGLALTHYRVLIFAVLFAAAFWLVEVRARWGTAQLVRIVWLGLGAGLLFLPWFIHTFAGLITVGFAQRLTTPAVAAATNFMQIYNAVGPLDQYLPIWLWMLAGLAFGWGLWRRDKAVLLVGVWWLLIILSANPQWLNLPGEGSVTNFAVFIAAYLPAALLLGAALGWLRQAVSPRLAVDLAVAAVVLVVAALGARQRLGDLNEASGTLVTAPDLRAAAWLQANTPPDARFLVNAFAAYGDSSVVGSDGGWWLPLLARRQTSVPPLNYSVELGPQPDYRLWINALPAEILNKGIDHPDVVQALHDRDLTHVYIGQLQGQVNNPGAPVLLPEQMLASPNFRPVYHQDRVWVFEVNK